MLLIDEYLHFSKRQFKIYIFQIFLKNVFKERPVLWGAEKWIQMLFIQNFIIAVLLNNFVDNSLFLIAPKSMLSKDENWHFSKRELKIYIFQIFLKNVFKKTPRFVATLKVNSEIIYSKFYNCCLIKQFCRYLSISTYSQKHAFKRWILTLFKKKIKFF